MTPMSGTASTRCNTNTDCGLAERCRVINVRVPLGQLAQATIHVAMDMYVRQAMFVRNSHEYVRRIVIVRIDLVARDVHVIGAAYHARMQQALLREPERELAQFHPIVRQAIFVLAVFVFYPYHDVGQCSCSCHRFLLVIASPPTARFAGVATIHADQQA